MILTALFIGFTFAVAIYIFILRVIPKNMLNVILCNRYGRGIIDLLLFIFQIFLMTMFAGSSFLAMATFAITGVITSIFIYIHYLIIRPKQSEVFA